MRGAEGVEKSIRYGAFWGTPETRTGHVAESIARTFQSLVAGLAWVPTLYARFTFTVRNVREILSGGSPKVITAKAGKITMWFLSSGLAYTLHGAREQTEKSLDAIGEVVREADEGAQFFLEFVTCRAYRVKQ